MALSGVLFGTDNQSLNANRVDQSDVVQANRMKPSYIEELEIDVAKGQGVLNLIAQKAKQLRPVKQGFYRNLILDEVATVAECSSASTTTITMASGESSKIRAGQIVQVASVDGSQTRVASVSGDDVVTEDDISANISSGTELQIMASSQAEGFNFDDFDSITVEPTIETNYTQQSIEVIEASKRHINSDNFGSDDLARYTRQAMDRLVKLREKSIFFGQQVSTKDKWRSKGLKATISTNTVTSTSSQLTESDVWTLLRSVGRRNSNMESTLALFCGEYVMSWFMDFLYDKVEGTYKDSKLGVTITELCTPFIPKLQVIRHPLLTLGNDSGGTWAGQAYLLQLKHFGLAYHKWTGAVTRLENVQTNGATSIKKGLVSDWGTYLPAEVCHGFLGGAGDPWA